MSDKIPSRDEPITIDSGDWHKLFEKSPNEDDKIAKARAIFTKNGCYD